MTKQRHCVVIGTGRVAGGFVAPLLHTAGWETLLVGCDASVVNVIAQCRGVWLREGAHSTKQQWIDGVSAVTRDDAALPAAVRDADLLATSVGPSALRTVGYALAPLLRARLESTPAPVNIITFENHRRAPELLASGIMERDASLAREIGQRIGIGGAAVWRAISQRAVEPWGVAFTIDDVDECYVDGASLLAGVAPHDGSLPHLALVRSFDDRMVEKLWLFNAGHAAAAYGGWLAGCATINEAMALEHIRNAVVAVVDEARTAFAAHLAAKPGTQPIPPRAVDEIVARYADPSLADPVVRVGREPRRKLAADDRLIAPALACMAAGIRPVALARAAAAALAYNEHSDPQAPSLQKDLQLLGPEDVLAMVSTLDPHEELARQISDSYRTLINTEVAR